MTDDIRRGLPKIFDSVPDDIIRVVESRILELESNEVSSYHAAMYVACQFAYQIVTGGTK